MSQAELIISGTATETAIIVLFNTVGVTAEKTDISGNHRGMHNASGHIHEGTSVQSVS
jgi:hypothetical protein